MKVDLKYLRKRAEHPDSDGILLDHEALRELLDIIAKQRAALERLISEFQDVKHTEGIPSIQAWSQAREALEWTK